MSKVLFLCNIALDNPQRGTPIHVARLLRELRKDHDLTVCAKSVPEGLKDIFVPYPTQYGIGKLCSMLRIVTAHQPATILTIGQTGLLAPIVLKYIRGIRAVVELQGVEFEEKYAAEHIDLLGYWLWKYKVFALLPLYDSVFAMSKRAAAVYPMSERWKIVYPAIDVDMVPHVEHHSDSETFCVGYMGNTRAYQGLTYLIKAVALARKNGLDARMHLVLNGDDSDIRSQVAQCGLEDVTTIVRDVSQQEAHREMLKTSVLVIPRPSVPEAIYGFPSKLPESLATGLPVIMTDVGPVAELRPEIDRHCIVIPADDIIHHLADALERVAGMPLNEKKQRGDAAREYAKKFSWGTLAAIVSREL